MKTSDGSASAKKASHTPFPWPKIEAVFISQPDGDSLNFGGYRFPYLVDADGWALTYPREEALANADLINRAVAAHQALVDALHEAVVTIKALHGKPGLEIYDRCAPEMKKIYAALSLAEGK